MRCCWCTLPAPISALHNLFAQQLAPPARSGTHNSLLFLRHALWHAVHSYWPGLSATCSATKVQVASAGHLISQQLYKCGTEACVLCRCPPVCQTFSGVTSWIETQPQERCAGSEVL